MEFLTEFISPLILAGCLAVGFVCKFWIPDDRVNKFIPLISMVCGILFAWWDAGVMLPVIFVQGAISGLAATGTYELFHNFISAAYLPCAETKEGNAVAPEEVEGKDDSEDVED